MRFLRKIFLLPILAVFLLACMFVHVSSTVASSNYLPVTTPIVGKGLVYELGVISASFNPYQLKKDDIVIFRLPQGFIWTTAEIQSNRNAALAASQSSADWNNLTVNANYLTYGTANYINVPRRNDQNGLFKGATPVFNIEKAGDNAIKLKMIEDPTPGQECFLNIYPNKIYVDGAYQGDISLIVDAPSDSGFNKGGIPNGQVDGTGDDLKTKIQCNETPTIYAGLTSQKIGSFLITAEGLVSDSTLTLQLPDYAKWVKLNEDNQDDIKIKTTNSLPDNSSDAEFKFVGTAKSTKMLTLQGMAVAIKPGATGELKVKVGGTAGLSGELVVAKMVSPTAVFAIGQKKCSVNGIDLTMDVAPYLRSDRVYLPIRFVSTALGVPEANIKWNEIYQSVEIKKENNVISMTIGSKTMYINNKPILMDVTPEFIEPGRIMLPLRWAAQALGVNVFWDSTSQQVAVGNF